MIPVELNSQIQATELHYFAGERQEMLLIVSGSLLFSALSLWLWWATRTDFAATFALTVIATVLLFSATALSLSEPGGMRKDWAGDSMTIPPISEPYRQTVDVFADMLRNMSGTESSDPAKVAAIVLGMAQQEDAPICLLIGADSAQYAALLAISMAESDRKWHDVSISAEAIDTDPAQYTGRLASSMAKLDQK